MTTLRKRVAKHDGLPVSYGKDVTEEQVRKIDKLVEPEFEGGEWVTVEEESWAAVGLIVSGDSKGQSHILPVEPILQQFGVTLVSGHNV